MATSQTFKQLYYEQYILPLTNDTTLSTKTRSEFKKMGKHLLKFKKPLLTDGPS